ncbi:protease inhibitor I42 family protein [Niameybacter massiliensis]|uniref:Protease inhibitor I42 family protein n=1 Tax=Holtiella tumoricola TaxID=3018743 RepID=A0AA42DL44_9FIRM|nr:MULTISPECIES: protease inhibitor I42 family protein [Lachnospirales]MDA3730751.1 protease inhibitor I42 family protein [Holtiella tumoricola]
MNTQVQTAIVAWTLLSILNQSEEQTGLFRHTGDKIEEVKYQLLPGYNQATVGQNMKIELDEQVDGRFKWQLNIPQGMKITEEVVNDHNKHVWLIQATRAGRYKIMADYVDKKRMSRIRKRILFEVEVLPCACGSYPDKKQNTTK